MIKLKLKELASTHLQFGRWSFFVGFGVVEVRKK